MIPTLNYNYSDSATSVQLVCEADPSVDDAAFNERPKSKPQPVMPKPRKVTVGTGVRVDLLALDSMPIPARDTLINPLAAPAWQLAALSQLSDIGKLSKNWDGYGSEPISMGARAKAATVLAEIQLPNIPAPSISPVSGGGLQVDWQFTKNAIELHFDPSGEVEYLIIFGGQHFEGALDRHPLSLRTMIKSLM